MKKAIKKRLVAVLITGGGSNLQALIDASKQEKYPVEIALVVSNKADAYGLERAKEAGITCRVIDHNNYSSREAFDAALHGVMVEHHIEIICLAGFMRVLTDGFVAKWEGKMLNIHPSLLPKYKGLDTHARALNAGDKEHGCSVHYVSAELDAGEVIMQASVPVLPDDTAELLAARVLEQEHRIYTLALAQMAESIN